jgi:hypothetical protein
MGAVNDHFSECVALTMHIGRTPYHGFLANALADGTLGPCSLSVPTLRASRSPAELVDPPGYEIFRYWQGYTVVARPVLEVFSVKMLRALMAVALVASFAGLLAVITRRAGWWVALALAAAFLLTVDLWDLPASFPHVLPMVVAFGTSALVLAHSRSKDPWTWWIWPLVAGCAYNFFDSMTNPPLAWCLCAFVVGLAVFVESSSPTRTLLASISAAGGWLAGYGGTWAVKWVIDIFAFGWHAFRTDIVHEIHFRSGGKASSWEVIRHVMGYWTGPIHRRNLVVFIVLVVVIGVFVARSIDQRRFASRLLSAAALGWPALLVFLWFSVVRQQSWEHAWFTYRSLAMAFAVVAAGIACATRAGGLQIKASGSRTRGSNHPEESIGPART